jgi:glyoxylase-like metal-dependent hydrolase (beta-lactamase superfamily II)/8-oxo-dGTP pyrophosphatase MutT (NUDIX family)
MPDPVVPRPAATVVLLRPAPAGGFEVLLTKRPSTMAFAADMYVFPGGALDAGDLDARAAALRELDEEASVRLAGPEALTPLSRWVTPPFVPRRFDVEFFAAQLPPGVEPAFASDEVVDHRWLTPRDGLDAMAGGELGLWVPTSTTLQQLEHVRSWAEVVDRLAPRQPGPIEVEAISPAITRVTLPGAGAVSGQSVNAYVVGRERLVVVDPGDPSDEAAEALLAVAATRPIDGLAITSAAPDHAAGAEALAGRLGDVPIFGGPGVGRDLPYQVAELADGHRVPAGDTELRVLTTPGTRPEHVAFVVPAESAAIVGDLVGPPASRSVQPAPDAAGLERARQRVAALRTMVLAAHA